MCAGKVGDLPISSQQLVEIAKALTLDCRVLIFDEPTAALTEIEAQVLFGDHPRPEGAGHLDHLYQPPHGRNLQPVRPGHRVSRRALCLDREGVADLTPDEVVRRMVGREITQLYPEKQAPARADRTRLILSVRGSRRRQPLHGMSASTCARAKSSASAG